MGEGRVFFLLESNWRDGGLIPHGWILLLLEPLNGWREGDFLPQGWNIILLELLSDWREGNFLPQGWILLLLELLSDWKDATFLPRGWIFLLLGPLGGWAEGLFLPWGVKSGSAVSALSILYRRISQSNTEGFPLQIVRFPLGSHPECHRI